jgi:hypothetical protein
MSSTILSALSGEQVLHSNSLATVTDNWIVTRDCLTNSQSLISIKSLSWIKTAKTINLPYLASSAGTLLIAAAAQFSKEECGAALPIALAGLALFGGALVARQTSIVFMVDSEVVRTGFGTMREAATVVAAVKSAQSDRYSWVRAYIGLLV